MKKEYTKPLLAIEFFQLDAAIAGSCSDKIILNQSLEGCTLEEYYMLEFGVACGLQGGTDLTQKKPPVCYQALASSDLAMMS